MSKNKFTWGDSVIVIESAPLKYNPGMPAEVCGVHTIQNETVANDKEGAIGEFMYIIEFADGSDVELLERYLRPDNTPSDSVASD